MIKLSIIIPMYNEGKYIGRCLESLKEQTFNDFEIILIDDGSRDNTVKIAKSFEDDFQLTILEQKHGGPGKARNRGAKEAKGDILIFVDADMYFDKNFLKNLVNPIIKGDEIGTSQGTEIVGNMENIWAKTWCINRIPNIGKRIKFYRAIKKDIFLNAGGFDDKKGYFDDDLSHINTKGSLVVMNAICYHNNPETLKEAFNHEIWVGKSLFTKQKLLKLLIIFITTLILTIFVSKFFNINIFYIVLSIIFIGLFILEYFAVKKIINSKMEIEKYHIKNSGKSLINYLRSFPILSIVRILGYLYGAFQFLYTKKNN